LPLLAGLAVRDVVATFAPRAEISLKWPNDLLSNGRKLAGLLCERVHKADLVGLGINVNVDRRDVPPDVRDRVISLSELAGAELDMTDLLVAVTRGLRAMLSHRNEQSFTQLLRRYDEHHALIGRRVRVVTGAGEMPVSGTCEGLDAMGRLLLRDRSKLHRVIAGEVKML